jgi:hypothetical protein
MGDSARSEQPPLCRLGSGAELRWASFACIHERRMVDQAFTNWNRISNWLLRLKALEHFF